jgi:hypothetical protein
MGWAERVKRRQNGGFRELSAARCRSVATGLREGLQALALTVPDDASLAGMLRDADWLGSGPDDLFHPEGRVHEDMTRFAKAFMRMEQATRVADFLLWTTRIRGSQQHARLWIRKRIDRTETQDEQGQDLMFEMEIAGRLARWPGLEIEFAEPDILVRYPADSPPMALACKRPRSEASLGRAVEEARQQLGSSGHRGAIVVGTEAIFHRSDYPSRPIIYSVETPREAREGGEQVLENLARAIRAYPQRMFDRNVGGVMLCGILTYWSKRPSAYGYAWIRRVVANTALPGTADTMRALDHLLFEPPPPAR